VKLVMFSGKFVHHQERTQDEVDALIVGTVVLPELAKLVRLEEVARKTEINYTVMPVEEFIFRRSRRDPFVMGILGQSRVMIIGTETDLLS